MVCPFLRQILIMTIKRQLSISLKNAEIELNAKLNLWRIEILLLDKVDSYSSSL